jgi:hypothetical protein
MRYTFSDGISIGHERGRFDNFAVLFRDEDNKRAAQLGMSLFAHDHEYFELLNGYYTEYGEQVYEDFMLLNRMATKTVNQGALKAIEIITEKYPESDRLDIHKLYAILYYTQISEENYRNTKLGKRLKSLGVYQTLKLGMTAEEAANFSRGKGWRDLDAVMKSYGL